MVGAGRGLGLGPIIHELGLGLGLSGVVAARAAVIVAAGSTSATTVARATTNSLFTREPPKPQPRCRIGTLEAWFRGRKGRAEGRLYPSESQHFAAHAQTDPCHRLRGGARSRVLVPAVGRLGGR